MCPDATHLESRGRTNAETDRTREFLAVMMGSLGIPPAFAEDVLIAGSGTLPSVLPVSDFAAAAVGTAGVAVAELRAVAFGELPPVTVDRRLASLWFGFSLRPIGWSLPSPWDPIAGDYATSDGWIRLHTNAPHHRAAALSVLDVPADTPAVAAAVGRWNREDLEAAIVANHGCAAAMRSIAEWRRHPQGEAVVREALVDARATADCREPLGLTSPHRALQGVRVLDLTRVLAGPVATRFLAGFGADVLRIDPVTWDEPGVVPEVTLGKRCARLDLATPDGKETFLHLLERADVLVHGYRSNALDALGLDARLRREVRPGLVDIALDAYGWSGPWKARRGFDSLVQMSVGIADAGMSALRRERPTPLPVQALDHATGYLMAAAAVRGLTNGFNTGRGFEARTSLARVAHLLMSAPIAEVAGILGSPEEADWSDLNEATDFGLARRLRSPIRIGSTPLQWDRPASGLGRAAPVWEG